MTGGHLPSAAREQLIRLRRRPEERPHSNPLLHSMQRDGLVVGRPLLRPSGKPSRYREWSITDLGLQLLGGRE